MQNNGWYKGTSGNSCCFSRRVRHTGIHRGGYIMQKKPPQKNPFPVGFDNAPLLPSLSPAQPRRARSVGQPAPSQPFSLLSPSQLPCVAPARCCSARCCAREKKKKKISAERSLSSENLLNDTFFLGRSRIYMGNLHVSMTVAEYFWGSPLLIFWQHQSVFPNCKCRSICHKAIGSKSLSFPVKGASQKHSVCCWDIRRGKQDERVAHCSSVPRWWRVCHEETSHLRSCIFLFTNEWTFNLVDFNMKVRFWQHRRLKSELHHWNIGWKRPLDQLPPSTQSRTVTNTGSGLLWFYLAKSWVFTSEWPLTVLQHPPSEVLPNVQSEAPRLQRVAMALHYTICRSQKELGPIFFPTPVHTVGACY